MDRIPRSEHDPRSDDAPDERVGELESRIAELEREHAADVERLHAAQAALANTQFELLRATERAKEAEARAVAPEAELLRFEPSRRPSRSEQTPSPLRAAAPRRAPAESPRSMPPRPDLPSEGSTDAGVDDLLRRRIARFQDDLNAYRDAIATPEDETAAPTEHRRRSDHVAPERTVDPHDERRPSRRGDPDEDAGRDGDRLSLRQRLASAANARHQVALTGDRRSEDADPGLPPPPAR